MTRLYKCGKKLNYGFIGAVSAVLVAVFFLNVLLMYHMTTKQTEIIGQNQIQSITNDLQSMLSDAEYMTSVLVANVEERIEQGATREELEAFFGEQSILQNQLSDGICLNAFLVCDDYIILPGLDLPDDFNVEERIWYKETLRMNPGDVYISPPYVDLVTGEMCFTVSKLLSDQRTVVALDFGLSRIQNSIAEMQNERGREALIVNANGLIVGYSDTDYIGKSVLEALPEYEKVYQRVTAASGDKQFFDSKMNGVKNKIFYSCTQNNWYLILSVQQWELYKDSYVQLIRNSLIGILLFVVVIVLYIHAQKNRIRAEKALSVKEEFLSNLSTEFRTPLTKILRSSDKEVLHISTNIEENMEEIRKAALQLSNMMDNLFSYSNLVSAEKKRNKQVKETRKVDMESQNGIRIRWQVIGVLCIAMILVMTFCARMIMDLGKTRMSKEVNNYNEQLGTWMTDRKTILDMFVYSIASQPELLDNREEAVAYLNNIAKEYPEISLAYMGNPNTEWKVIMNTGWVPDDSYILQAYSWYADTMSDSDGFLISNPYYDTQKKVYYLTFSEKIYGEDGTFLGVFAIDFYLDKLSEVLQEAYTENGYAFLINSNGVIMNHPNEAYQLSGNNSVNVQTLNYEKAYVENSEIKVLMDYDGRYKACISEHDDFSDFTIIVVKEWWSIYGGIVVYEMAFLILFGFCIFAVWHLIRKLSLWQQQVNIRLQESVDAAIDAAAAKSQFLAQMSHEIRTPINAVLGMNEMILRENESEDIREYAENIEGAGRTLLSLINSILDFSKIEDGKMEIIPVRYGVSELISDLVNMISDKVEKKDLLLELQIDERLPRVLYGDDVRVKQVITNLLTNAVKYTKEGKITLVIQRQEVTDRLEELLLHVEIIDTGIGIRREDMDKLFLSFQRLDEERNRNIEGTGLGISIVQSLLKMMGSSLQVESEYGKGSRFYFDLKQQIVDDTPIGSNAFHEKNRQLQKEEKEYLYAPEARVLIVDDNQMNLKVATGLLKRSKIIVDTAMSGMECIQKVEKGHYDIIFLDHMMPEMDGIETLRTMKNGAYLTKNTIVIVMTANAIVGAKDQYLSEGFDDYISKPVAVDKLEQMLATYLPKELVSFRRKEQQTAKQLAVQESEAEQTDAFTQEELLSLYGKIPQLNVLMGLSFCADSKMFYLEMLKEFACGKKDEELEAFLENEDWENYRITVHALKGNAKSIGAVALSEEALVLEMAAKEHRIQEIMAKHPVLLQHYRELQLSIDEMK